MKDKDPDAWLDDVTKEFEAERDADYSVTPEEGARLVKKYEGMGTPDGYERFTPEEFFDGK